MGNAFGTTVATSTPVDDGEVLTVETDETAVSVTLLALTRSDTGNSVATDTTAFTYDAGEDEWILPFVPPVTGIDYNFTALLLWGDGNTTPIEGSHYVAASGGTHFTTQLKVERFAGPENASVYADKQATETGATVDEAWEQALADTDTEIVSAFRVRLFNGGETDFATWDLVPGEVADAVDTAWLDETAQWGTTVKLYGGRGMADDGTSAGPSPDGKMATVKADYLARLEDIRTGTAILATAAAAGITAADEFMPVTVGDPVYPTVDADGRTAAASNAPSYWRGYHWDANAGTWRW